MAKKATSKKHAVAVGNQFGLTQQDVPNLLDQVNAKIKELKGEDETAHQTTGELDGFGNIFNINNPADLIKAYSSVKGRFEAYKKAAAEMGIKNPPPFKLGDSTADKWLIDIAKCYRSATHKQELDKLVKVKERLETLLSEEDKIKNTLSSIADILNS